MVHALHSSRDMLRTHIRLTSWAALGLALMGCGQTPPTSDVEDGIQVALARSIGMGLLGPRTWDGTAAFVDVVRHSSVGAADGVQLDKDGWPLGAGFIGLPALPLGTYRIVVDGRVPRFGSDRVPKDSVVYHPESNSTTADYVNTSTKSTRLGVPEGHRLPSDGETNTGFRNLRLYRPGAPTDGSLVYNPKLLELLQDVRVLRSMDWVETNQNLDRSWGQRPLPTWAGARSHERSYDAHRPGEVVTPGSRQESLINVLSRSYSSGAAWEDIVGLANAMNADLWVNVPFGVDDEYVRKLAQLIRFGSDGVEPYTGPQAAPRYAPLKATSKIYVELGNECWNAAPSFMCWRFQILEWYRQRGKGDSPVNYPDALSVENAGESQGRARVHALRSAEVSLIFRSVFGDAAMMRRVRPVLESQSSTSPDLQRMNTSLAELLRWADGYFNRPNVAGSLAPRAPAYFWFGGGGAEYYPRLMCPDAAHPGQEVKCPLTRGDGDLRRDEFFEKGTSEAYLSSFGDRVYADSVVALAYGLRNTTYEGGPSVGGSILGNELQGDLTTAQKRAYNSDPRIVDLMSLHAQAYRQNGGSLFVHYVAGGPASWEHVYTHEKTAELTANQKILGLAAENTLAGTTITAGNLVPATIPTLPSIPLRHPIIGTQPNETLRSLTVAPQDAPPAKLTNSDLLVPIRVASPGALALELTVVGTRTVPAAQLEVSVDGATVGVVEVPQTAATVLRTAPLSVSFSGGFHVVRVRGLLGTARVQAVSLR